VLDAARVKHKYRGSVDNFEVFMTDPRDITELKNVGALLDWEILLSESPPVKYSSANRD